MPASIQASTMSHVALCVRHLERSLQFYRDILGFQVTKDEVQDTSRGGLLHLYDATTPSDAWSTCAMGAPSRCPSWS